MALFSSLFLVALTVVGTTAYTGVFPPPYELPADRNSNVTAEFRFIAPRPLVFPSGTTEDEYVNSTNKNPQRPLGGLKPQGGLLPAATCGTLTPSNPSTFWREQMVHNGAPAYLNDNTYPVWRNVKDTSYGGGAKGDGNTDDFNAIQTAINAGTSSAWRYSIGTQSQTPALVYIPGGVYLVGSSLNLPTNTILVGDPLHMPTLKAASSLGTNAIIYAFDTSTVRNIQPTTQFYTGIRNLILDTTNVSPTTTANALNWPVSQAGSMFNVKFNMPNFSNHIGIQMHGVVRQADGSYKDLGGGSGTIISDLTFNGGDVGILMNNQQYNLKNISFNGCQTGIKIEHLFTGVFQGLVFQNGAIGIDTSSGDSGSIALLDSSALSVGTVVSFFNGNGKSLVIENLSSSNSGPTVQQSNGGNTLLSGSVTDSWVFGRAYVPGGPGNGASQSGTHYSHVKPTALTGSNGAFYTMQQPQYENHDVSQFVNVKTLGAKGDGSTNDGPALQSILNTYAGCEIVFFPAGTYLVYDTLYAPPGTRIVGEAWSVLSAQGSNFASEASPRPLLQVGKPGEVGIAQISDMLFTVADVLPGAILLEINISGPNKGDVGFWNTHFRVGGSVESKVVSKCTSGDTTNCKAAFLMLHVTSTGSPYIENMWGWTADHSLDTNNVQNIATGRGALIEGTEATWLVGTSFEHNALYQYNINSAQNVYIGMQQTETAYWQGTGTNNNAPSPWTANTQTYHDPNFAGCSSSSNYQQCTMGWAQRISAGSSLHIYGSAFWAFFNDMTNGCYCNGCTVCQSNMAEVVSGTKGLYYWNLNTKATVNMLVDGTTMVTQNANQGGWGGIVAAYLVDQ